MTKLKTLLVFSRKRWKKLSLNEKQGLLERSRYSKVVFISPNLINKNLQVLDFDEETIFIWSASILLYIYSFFQSKIIFNLRLFCLIPFRRKKVSKQLNQLVYKIQKRILIKFLVGLWDKKSTLLMFNYCPGLKINSICNKFRKAKVKKWNGFP